MKPNVKAKKNPRIIEIPKEVRAKFSGVAAKLKSQKLFESKIEASRESLKRLDSLPA